MHRAHPGSLSLNQRVQWISAPTDGRPGGLAATAPAQQSPDGGKLSHYLTGLQWAVALAALCSILAVAYHHLASRPPPLDLSSARALLPADDDSWQDSLESDEALPAVRVFVYPAGAVQGGGGSDAALRAAIGAERELLDELRRGRIPQTRDPEKATLFYVPFLSSRHVVAALPAGGGFGGSGGERAAAELFCRAVERALAEHPFFNRSGGRDHFSLLPPAAGRCAVLPLCRSSALYGYMFFLQAGGEGLAGRLIDGPGQRRHVEVAALDASVGSGPGGGLVPCFVRGETSSSPHCLRNDSPSTPPGGGGGTWSSST